MSASLSGLPRVAPPVGFLPGDASLSLECCANRAIYHSLALDLPASVLPFGLSLVPAWTFGLQWLHCLCLLSHTLGICGWALFALQFKCISRARVLNDHDHAGKPCAVRVCRWKPWGFRIFDSTMGYPGEGPGQLWSILSSNIGSFFKDDTWKGWNDSVVCLQETRIGRNNFRNASKSACAAGKNLILGDLLPGLFRSDGSGSTSHGGVAMLAPSTLSSPFEESQDTTGLFKGLFHSKRVQAVWHQVQPSLKILIFNIYAKSGASADHDILHFNDRLLGDVFQVAAQFGNIPVLVVGDFQLPPLQYPSVAAATHFANWFDPLSTHLEDGSLDRPITYSRDCTFTAFGEHCSSIDGMLLNHVAFSCLTDICTVDWFSKQHRPVRATFHWDVIFHVGPVHVKFAQLDISQVDKPSCPKDYQPSLQCWDANLEANFTNSTPEGLWCDINQFAVTTLLESGATWKPGIQKRAVAPVFRSKQYCPGQQNSGSATTLRLSWLYNARAKVFDIQAKVAKSRLSDQECDILHNALAKLTRLLRNLKAPFDLRGSRCPPLLTLHECHLWLQVEIAQTESNLKSARIRAWREKIQHSATSDRAYLFHHLKNKAQDQPNNLVTDDCGHIIYQPDKALNAINNQWDDIFASNIGHEDPVEVLRVLWPYLSRENKPWTPPALTGADIFETLQRRHPNAAPGLDGWRTTELQRFPLALCDLIAAFFRRLEQQVDHSLPRALTEAKLVILNKPGPSSPLNKRLITILPPLLLAYTGARFRQAKEWQATIMPPSIVGGIAGRHMTDIPATLRLDLDEAEMHSETVAGLKLDKSKCFDRIVPAFVAIILLAIGCPQHVVSIFVRQYAGLRKHLSYRGWTASIPTTSPNGVAQGCSFSLIAMNAYMLSWVAFLKDIPHLSCRIYIDDIYLWAKIQHVANLQTALEVTKLWDALVGQKLNAGKSVAWASNSTGRKCIRLSFPDFMLQETIDVLGSKIYTSQRIAFDFPEEKTHKIVLDIRNIGALPLPRKIKAQLLGAKVIPQCSFASHLSKVPKAALDKIQAEITQVLWGKRPHWRAKHLVLGFLAPPHRVDPYLARAYCAIVDFLRFVHHNPDVIARCRRLANQPNSGRFSLLVGIRQACHAFGITIDDQLHLHLFGHLDLNLQDLSVRDIVPLLKQLAVQAHYAHSASLNRKDFAKPDGFVDLFHSKLFGTQNGVRDSVSPPLLAHFEAQLVGCTITNDRRFAAKFSDSPLCRFCETEKESLVHILQCPQARQQFPPGPGHEFGPNFRLLGIVEHPFAIIRHRLHVDRADALPVQIFHRPDDLQSLWSDGSVLWGEVFPLTAAGYAIIDEEGKVFHAGTVSHLCLSSYTAELWAVIVATLKSDCKLHIYSDCKEVVCQVNHMVQTGNIPTNCLHIEWWKVLHKVIVARSLLTSGPVLLLTWIPSHVGDDLPVSVIPATVIRAAGTTRKHIELNQLADAVAKRFARSRCTIAAEDKGMFQAAILQKQRTLTDLNRFIGFECSDTFTDTPMRQSAASEIDFHTIYPGLAWNHNEADFSFSWKPEDSSCPPKLDLSASDWQVFVNFGKTLKWFLADHVMCTYQELAFLFVIRGHHFRCREAHFQELVLKLRKCCVVLSKTHNALPGTPTARATKCIGKVLLQGALVGALPFFAPGELFKFCRVLAGGAGRSADSWSFPVERFL